MKQLKISITALNSMHRAHFMGGGRVLPVTRYGCYYCGEVYAVEQLPIEEWVDGGETALCPVCGIDAVIPEILGLQLTQEMMRELHREMF